MMMVAMMMMIQNNNASFHPVVSLLTALLQQNICLFIKSSFSLHRGIEWTKHKGAELPMLLHLLHHLPPGLQRVPQSSLQPVCGKAERFAEESQTYGKIPPSIETSTKMNQPLNPTASCQQTGHGWIQTMSRVIT